MLSVYIIDDKVYRYGLISILEEYPEFQVVGNNTTIEFDKEEIAQTKPDIIIADIFSNAAQTPPIEVLETIKEVSPLSKILVLTQTLKQENCLDSIKAGAKGYLIKGLDISELLECIRIVAGGDAMVFSSAAAKTLESTWCDGEHSKKESNELSDREKEILEFVAQGISTKEIATKCFVSETTVKAHIKSVMHKLNAKNRAQAVAKAIEKGLFTNHLVNS